MNDAGEILNKAYALAFFIHADEELARRIVLAAMSRLEVAVAAQDKRLYYSLKGRATSRKSRSKISLSEPHLLQRLVYVESEPFEKQKEQNPGLLNEEDLVAHFVKHLLKITLKRNSFYVTLGVGRVLHNYSTTETMEIHAVAVQDPDRVGDESYYRACKGTLMKEMKERFGHLLRSVRVNRGEERFQTVSDSSRYAAFIRECLVVFTPWMTRCVIPDGYNPTSDLISPLSFMGGDPDEEHLVEVHRVHSIVHPDCFERLVKALRRDAPEVKLEIPNFSFPSNEEKPPRNRRRDISEAEKALIEDALAEQSARRRASHAGLLRIMVDGAERATIDLSRSHRVRLEIDSSTDLIEVMTTDESGELLLASRLVDLSEANSNRSIILEAGQQINILVTADGDKGTAVEVSYRETRMARAAALFFKRKKKLASDWVKNHPALKPALTFALVAIVATAAALIYWSIRQSSNSESQAAENQPHKSTPENRNPETKPPSTPDEAKPQQDQAPVEQTQRQVERSQQTAQSKQPAAKLPEDSKVIAGQTQTPRPEQIEDPFASDATRNLESMRSAASLAEVKQIYIEPGENDSSVRQLKARLVELLNSSGRFTATTNADEAEAALDLSKVKVGKGTLSAVVQLVNAKGKVIWRASQGRRILISMTTAEAVVSELIKDAQASERRQKR